MSYTNQPPTGRDPHQSFDRGAPPPVSIDSYALPRSRAPLWIGLGAVVAITATVLIALFLPASTPAPTATPTPIPATSSTARATPSPTGSAPPSVGFEDRATGWWRIDEQRWTGVGLELTITVRVSSGQQGFSFFCFDADRNTAESNNAYDPGAFPTRTIGEGEEVTGKVTFGINPGDTTVVLANASGTQISALMVKGP